MLIDSENYRGNLFSNLFRRWPWSKDTAVSRFFQNIILGSETPDLVVNKDDLMTPFTDCPHLSLAIIRKAEMFSNGEWKCVSIKDEEQEFPDDKGLTLLNKPNPLQSREDFLFQYSLYKDLFANNFIYKNSGSSLVLPKTLWHLPSEFMEIMLTGKFFDQVDLEGIIKHFKLCYGGGNKTYEVKDVIYHATNFSFADGMGKSKIPSLNYPISNIMASLKARNIITTKKGALGILSNEGKNSMGGVSPIGDPEKKRIEAQFDRDRGLYGDRSTTIITNAALKYSPMIHPIRDLMIHESDEMDFQTILGEFGLDRDIFPSTQGATFENKKQGLIMTYQNTIQPEADSFAGIISEALGATSAGRKYILDYSWLPIMSEDKHKKAEEKKLAAETAEILYRNGIISAETFALVAGAEMTGTGKGQTVDSLGKVPLALQQLALARERANTAGDTALSASLSNAMDILTLQLVESVVNPTK